MAKAIKGKKGCFPAGVKVAVPSGYVAIEELEIGDKILCWDTAGDIHIGSVTETFVHEDNGDFLCTLHHKEGKLTSTVNHYILSDKFTFREADQFEKDDGVFFGSGEISKISKVIISDPVDKVYNLSVEPYPTFIAENVFVSNKGGGKDQEARTPVEAPNSLQGAATARVIDVLCEGEIEGWGGVDADDSIFFDESPLGDFEGVTTEFRTGTTDQDVLQHITNIESETGVSTQLSYGNPIIKTITNDEVDDVRVTLSTPQLLETNIENGDISETSVTMTISISAGGGGYSLAKTVEFNGKCTSKYARSIRIKELSSWGNSPWGVKVERITEDSGSAYTQNNTYWDSYTEITNGRLNYPGTCLVGFEVQAREFGNRIPRRAFHIQGRKIRYPSNYNPVNRQYTGEWDGTFDVGYCNNPAWVVFDLLTDDRAGLGMADAQVDFYSLYECAVYNDTYIDDGYGDTEPRFVFNGVIQTQEESYHVVNMACSNMRVQPFWAAGKVTFVQDRPVDATRLVTAANVVEGVFNYEGTGTRARHTAVNVTYNDIDNFMYPAIEVIEDPEGIDRYGWNPIDVYAYGCTSRGQAFRTGKWILESEMNQTEGVKFKAGFDMIDCIPGEVIKIADQHYAAVRLGGRFTAVSGSTLYVDKEVEIEGGETYSMSIVTASGTVEEIDITNSVGTYTAITLDSEPTIAPQIGGSWVITASNVEPRLFRVVSNLETEPHQYEIHALFYDPNKYARVEEGIYFDEPPTTLIPTGALEPPTALAAEEYMYTTGGQSNHHFGVMLSWTHADDPRFQWYDCHWKFETISGTGGPYVPYDTTVESSMKFEPVTSGTYDFRVRSVGVAGYSPWAYLTNLIVHADPGLPPTVSGLQVRGGGTTFSGIDCEIEWDALTDPTHAQYKIEVYTTGDALLRTEYTVETNYMYSYGMNQDDNSGTAIRSMKFKLYSVNWYDDESATPATLTASNPAPTMAGLTPTVTDIFKGLKIDWSNITAADNDLEKYKVYVDTDSPPTAEVAEVSANTTYWFEMELDAEIQHFVQIEPFDGFGVGTKSNITDGEPLKLSGDDIDIELVSNLTMSDSQGTTSSGLAVLYDRIRISDGITYTASGTDSWIMYSYPVPNIYDGMTAWVDGAAHVYAAYSEDNEIWSYLKAEGDHTLDSNGALLPASNQADAQTNYWTLAAGKNHAKFPAGLVAQYVKIYIVNDLSPEVYEWIPAREVVAELVFADQLSTITADVGTLTAGTIQSNNLTASDGYLFDLDNDSIKFGGTSSPEFEWDGAEVVLSTADGKTIWGSNKIEIKDGGNVTRVIIGKLT